MKTKAADGQTEAQDVVEEEEEVRGGSQRRREEKENTSRNSSQAKIGEERIGSEEDPPAN
eukprot:scaffold2320_cov168-Ochromonas_danica.AAC.3